MGLYSGSIGDVGKDGKHKLGSASSQETRTVMQTRLVAKAVTHSPPHVQSYRSLLASIIQLWEPKVGEGQTAMNQIEDRKQHGKAFEAASVNIGFQSIAQLRLRVTRQNQGILN